MTDEEIMVNRMIAEDLNRWPAKETVIWYAIVCVFWLVVLISFGLYHAGLLAVIISVCGFISRVERRLGI